ncbi:MAG: hypothetical protein ACTSQW_09460 [Promethearchaeota archaeon]
MVYIIVVATYPPHLAAEVGKVYIEAMGKFPDDRSIVKPVVLAAIQSTSEGIRATSISSVKPGKLKEAFDIYGNRMLIFGKLAGFLYSVNVAYDAGEAMSMVGMTAPE